jgi:DNA mismatch repair protein PMS2
VLEEGTREVSRVTLGEDRGDDNEIDGEMITGRKDTQSSDVGLVHPNTAPRGEGRAVSSIEKFLGEKTMNQRVQRNGRSVTDKASEQNTDHVARDNQIEDVELNSDGQESQGGEKVPSEGVGRAIEVPPAVMPIIDFNRRISEQEGETLRPPPLSAVQENEQDQIPSAILSTPRRPAGVIQSAFDRMRPKRVPADTATITIGSKTVTSSIGTRSTKRQRTEDLGVSRSGPVGVMKIVRKDPKNIRSTKRLRAFAASGTQPGRSESETEEAESSRGEEDSANEELPTDSDTQMDTDESDFPGEDNLLQSVDSGPGQAEEGTSAASEEDNSDGDYIDEVAKKAREEDKVRRMIRTAEEEAARSSQDRVRRAGDLLKTRRWKKDSTTQLVRIIDTSVTAIDEQVVALSTMLGRFQEKTRSNGDDMDSAFNQSSAEERLSLTVSKEDFAQMRVIGQFNLGFIIACRSAEAPTPLSSHSPSGVRKDDDELFIIDQHASDEKYNFERLQAETVVQNQRLVKPRILELTAVEEEIVIEHQAALEKNGFLVEVDEDMPTGKRCKLVSLPMSRGVVFDHRDLEELIALLADVPAAAVPRPSRVRRMFASRACRSSIMIGHTLTLKQMQTILRHMGEIEKPWNCPHGRPTMRHLMGMKVWEGWEEGDGLVGMRGARKDRVDWGAFVGAGVGTEDEGEE